MKRLSALLLGACLVLLLSTDQGQGADPIGDKLEKAKAKFEQEMKKAKEMAKKYFDDREDKARKAKKDNKKLLDEVNDEKKAFEEHGLLGEKAPRDLKTLITTQQSLLKAAYVKAADEYTKAKNDEMSAAITKEWDQIKEKGFVSVAPPGELWIPLFNGTDLRGWEVVNPNVAQKYWKVVDGAIQGENPIAKGEAIYLNSTGIMYENFHLRMEVFCAPKSTSGLLFRTNGGVGGQYQASLSSGRGTPGTIAKENKALGLRILKQSDLPNPPASEWFTFELIAKGYSIRTLINGKKAVEVTDEDKVSPKGRFALVVGEESVVRVRNIKILPLPQDPKK
jgi:hypothetical protein